MAKLFSYMSDDKNAKLVGIFFLAIVVFNFPLVAIFGKDRFLFGVPLLYAYIFVVWLGIIALVFFNSRKKKGK